MLFSQAEVLWYLGTYLIKKTAKSIFRFGDLQDNNDVKLTAYILIGTLLSFGLAIVMAKIHLKLINIT